MVKYISADDTVISVEVLPCCDDRKFLEKVQKSVVLTGWNGRTGEEAARLQPATVTGATCSSRAIIPSVRTTLENHLGN